MKATWKNGLPYGWWKTDLGTLLAATLLGVVGLGIGLAWFNLV